MFKNAKRAAEMILTHENDSINIVSHMDPDGITAAAIISKALDRKDIRNHVKFVQMLYPEVIDELEVGELTIFTDLGSSQLGNLRPKFGNNDVIIADHHSPEKKGEWSNLVHFNAHLENLDGVEEISGAGMAYLIAKELDKENKPLAALALIGAIGDIQNGWGKLKGYNRKIAEDGIEAGVVEKNKDLLLYGRHTKPIFETLKNLTDPQIPGVSNNTEGCVSMLKDLDIPYKTDDGYRRPVDLTKEEKKKLATELITRSMSSAPEELIDYIPGLIVGEVYTILTEEENSLLRGADEFSTCINSTARHEQPLIGLEVAKGDRDVYYRQMLKLLKYHRRCIAKGMSHIKGKGIETGPNDYIQYFDASDVLKETFVGTIASLILGQEKSDPYKPMVGIVKHDDVAKVSARCSKLLFLKGLDLGQAMKKAANNVGGDGGGHAVACGAQVGREKVTELLKEFEKILIETDHARKSNNS